jgi:uncharacterized protein YwgA
MTVSTRDVVLALIAYGSDVQPEFGRTALQKVAFFAGIKSRIPLGHRAFYYGPFSSVVEDETEALVLAGMVTESVTDLGFVNRKGFPGVRYSYALTNDGLIRLAAFEASNPTLVEQLKTTVSNLIEAIGSLDQSSLSLAAKTYFIAAEQEREVSSSEIQELAKQKSWDISQHQIERVASFLEKLQLVELKK